MSWADILSEIGSGRRRDGEGRLSYADAPPYFLTAYGIAVKQGFSGTEEEWLASLKGPPGDMDSGDYDPDTAVANAGGIPAYVSGAVAGKQDSLTFDAAPTQESSNPVKSGGVYTALAGKQGSIALASVALSAAWSGQGPYTQTVTVTGAAVTGSSKVDLQPTAAQLESLMEDGVTALTVENNAGTLTACALGAAPSAAMTVQCTVTEVGA